MLNKKYQLFKNITLEKVKNLNQLQKVVEDIEENDLQIYQYKTEQEKTQLDLDKLKIHIETLTKSREDKKLKI